MRARNPWVRLRLITLGWYVRFIGSVLSVGIGGNGIAAKGRQTYCLLSRFVNT